MNTLTNMKGRIALVVLAFIIIGRPDLNAQGMVIETRGGNRSVEMLNLIVLITTIVPFIPMTYRP
jgi:hypothetical protein